LTVVKLNQRSQYRSAHETITPLLTCALRTVFADLVLFISGHWRLFVLVSFIGYFFWLRARKLIAQLDFESMLNSSFVSYRLCLIFQVCDIALAKANE